MKGIRPDAPDEAIGAILRALAPLLVYRITKVRKVTKRTIFFVNNAVPAAPAAVAVPVEPEIVTLLAPTDPIIPIWKAKKEEKFAFALLAPSLWELGPVSLWGCSGDARIGFCMGRDSARAPPANKLFLIVMKIDNLGYNNQLIGRGVIFNN